MSGWLAHPGPARTHSSATAGVHGHTDGELGQRPGQGMDVDEMEGDIGDGEDIDMAFDDGDFGMPQDVSDNEDMIEMESPDSRSSDQSSDDEGYETPVARKMRKNLFLSLEGSAGKLLPHLNPLDMSDGCRRRRQLPRTSWLGYTLCFSK
ncbi:hypothetical protein B0H11DRAFT_1905085 [Mycena galericulata]|nr:hypothetical protein B0H11DRAFT_1905085 [Mycena galericulata]